MTRFVLDKSSCLRYRGSAMPKTTLILKIGGSIVTEKYRSTPAIRRQLVIQIGKVIKRFYKPSKHQLILIHGAGSFGHISAKKFGLTHGTRDSLKKLPAALANKTLDQHLNVTLAHLFQSVGLPVTGINTSSSVLNRAGKFHTIFTEHLNAALRIGAIPLLHGDMVFDQVWGMSICSGDVLLPELAKHFRSERVFYASDVDGIFTSDPFRNPDATLIREISLADLLSPKIRLSTSHHTDVTAGFSGKFSPYKSAKLPALEIISVFNGLIPKNYTAVFHSKKNTGTTIHVKKVGGRTHQPPSQSA